MPLPEEGGGESAGPVAASNGSNHATDSAFLMPPHGNSSGGIGGGSGGSMHRSAPPAGAALPGAYVPRPGTLFAAVAAGKAAVVRRAPKRPWHRATGFLPAAKRPRGAARQGAAAERPRQDKRIFDDVNGWGNDTGSEASGASSSQRFLHR